MLIPSIDLMGGRIRVESEEGHGSTFHVALPFGHALMPKAGIEVDLPTIGDPAPLENLRALVVDDKWLATLQADVQTELDRVSQALSGRIRQLAERYTTPLPELNAAVEALTAKVNGHLAKMGFAV